MSAVTRFQILRGSTAQRLAFIPLQGELVHDTQSNFLYIGDGATFGGVLAAPLASAANKLLIIVRNESGALLPKGTPVYISGNVGALPLVDKAIASDLSKSDVIGILESDLSNNSTTTCVISGEIINLDLSAFVSGDQIYLAPTGGLTKVKPVEPNFIVAIGNIEKADASGILFVHINDPVELPNLPNNHVPIGQTGGNTTTVDIDAKIVANAQVTLNTTHRGRTDNPHATTKAQVGLGNADNTSDVNKPVSTAQAAAIASAQSTAISTSNAYADSQDATHFPRTDNPHATTKAQVGLGDADNTSDVNKPVSTAQATAISTAQTNAQSYADTKDATHFPRTDNPHAVTKAQVGLGNVDNTNDLNKPISSATQTALNLKYDASNPNGYETPTQLNARDVQNRARANHTGTQTASTISDFAAQVAASVLSTVLTGISFASSAAVVATDTVLQAFGKLQAQITLRALISRLINTGYGLTGGGDLSVDRTHAVSLSFQEVTANNTITTTSGADVLMTGMTITPVAGTYLVLFKSTLSGGNDDSSITPSIYSGGVLQTGSGSPVVANVSGGLSNPNTTTMNAVSFSVVTVNGSQAIEGRWRRASGTATAADRHLKLIRLA